MFLAAWIGHTDRSRALAHLVRDAIRMCGWKEDYAARLMGLTGPQLSRQLAGQEPLNVWRLAELPDVFQQRYDALRAEARGAILLEVDQVMLIRGALVLGRKGMAKCLPQLVRPVEASVESNDEQQQRRA